MSESLDRIEQSIERLNTAINVLVDEFIRPSAQQTTANYEQLHRVDNTIERMSQASAAIEQQTAANAESITRIGILVENNARAIAANERRFENLLNESRADRAEWRISFDAQQEVIQRLLLEIRSSNGEIFQLRVRVDDLEAG